MKRDPFVIIVVAMVVALMLVFGFKLGRRSSQTSGTAQIQDGNAPDFTLQTIQGKTIRLSDFRGRPVVLNFWATWCGPCKIEMPWFVDFQKQYGPAGVQFLGVAMDDASTKDIAEFAQSMKVN